MADSVDPFRAQARTDTSYLNIAQLQEWEPQHRRPLGYCGDAEDPCQQVLVTIVGASKVRELRQVVVSLDRHVDSGLRGARALWRHRQSETHCDDLFAVWKAADTGVPVIAEARAEYARLK